MDAALNCQLPARLGVGCVTGGFSVGDAELEVGAGPGTPPHRKRRTVAERAKNGRNVFHRTSSLARYRISRPTIHPEL